MTEQRRPLIDVPEKTLRTMASQEAETYNQSLLKWAAILELQHREAKGELDTQETDAAQIDD